MTCNLLRIVPIVSPARSIIYLAYMANLRIVGSDFFNFRQCPNFAVKRLESLDVFYRISLFHAARNPRGRLLCQFGDYYTDEYVDDRC